MATQDELDLTDRLVNEITTRQWKIRQRDTYYHGAQRLSMIGLSTPPEMRELQTVVNWCRTTVDALAERLDVEGFRSGNKDLDKILWDWWKRNDMEVQSDSGHIESLVQAAGFVVVSVDPDNPQRPIFTVESAKCIGIQYDQFGKQPISAVRYYTGDDGRTEYATLYLLNETVFLLRQQNKWVEVERDVHNLGIVPVVPLINRVRVNDWFGETEMKDVMSIVDAVCRTATNLSTASETLAVPSRYVIGASRDDFVDESGKPVPAWEGYLGRLNALMNENASVVQLSGADLKNFTETITMYGKLVSSLTGLPIHYLGVTTDGNPASAEAIVAGEARHVKRAERKQQAFGSAWSRVMYIACRLIFGESARELLIDTVWRDASTPTQAAKTDAIVKLKQVNLIPVEGAWIELGWDQEKRDLYRSLMSDDPLERLVAALGEPEPAEPPVAGDPVDEVA